MTPKEQALNTIADLVREHGITPEEIRNRLAATADSADSKTSVLTRLLSYLGGIFVIAGLGVFIEMQWTDMNAAARITVTLGSGIAAFSMAWIFASDERREKMVTPLFLIAGFLQPVGILVALDEIARGGDERHAVLFASGVMLVQQTLTFFNKRLTSILFMSILFALVFYATAMDLIGLDADLIAFGLGFSMLFVLRRIDQTTHASITPFWYFCASSTMLSGLFALVQDSPLEVLFLGAACSVVFWSTWVKSRSLLFVGTVAILSYVGYYTAEHFSDAVGWPVALILFGLLLIVLSAIAFRINSKYIAAR
jgi:hypothetical protein